MGPRLKRFIIFAAFFSLMSPNLHYASLGVFPGSLADRIQFVSLAALILIAPLTILPLRLYLIFLLPLGVFIPVAHVHLHLTGLSLDPSVITNILSSDSKTIRDFLAFNMNPIVIGCLFTIMFWSASFCIFHGKIDMTFPKRLKPVVITAALFLQVSLWKTFKDNGFTKVNMSSKTLVKAKKDMTQPKEGLFPTGALIDLNQKNLGWQTWKSNKKPIRKIQKAEMNKNKTSAPKRVQSR